MAMLMERRFSVMVGMLLRAELVVSTVHMKRSKTRQRKSRDRFTVRARNSDVSEFFSNPA